MPARHKAVIVSLVFLVSSGWTQKDSKGKSPPADPCAKAETQAEMNQCQANAWHRSDKRLNELYAQIVDSLQKDLDEAQKTKSDLVEYSATGLSNLKNTQQVWIVYRNLHCAAAKQRYEGGSMAPAVHAECLRQLTDHRIEELQHAYQAED
jgi:uncharacterized protein YecT (DUF1311 family)